MLGRGGAGRGGGGGAFLESLVSLAITRGTESRVEPGGRGSCQCELLGRPGKEERPFHRKDLRGTCSGRPTRQVTCAARRGHFGGPVKLALVVYLATVAPGLLMPTCSRRMEWRAVQPSSLRTLNTPLPW